MPSTSTDWDFRYGGGSGSNAAALVDWLIALPYWTLLKTVTATPGAKEVIVGPASAEWGQLYWNIRQTTASRLAIVGYLDFDYAASGGTGIFQFGDASLSYVELTTDGRWFFRAAGKVSPQDDEPTPGYQAFQLVTVDSAGSTARACYFGWLQRSLPPELSGHTSVPGSLTAGATSITVADDLTSKLKVGQKLLIHAWGHSDASSNKEKVEQVTVASVSATAIGITSGLANSYPAGARIGAALMPMASLQGTTLPFATGYMPFTLAGGRTAPHNQTASPEVVRTMSSNDDDHGLRTIDRYRANDAVAGGLVGYLYNCMNAPNEGAIPLYTRYRGADDNASWLKVQSTGLLLGPRTVAQQVPTIEQATEYRVRDHASQLFLDEDEQQYRTDEPEVSVGPSTTISLYSTEVGALTTGEGDFGGDCLTVPDLDASMALYSGARILGEALVRRFSTPRGLLTFHPDDGLDLRAYLNEGMTRSTLHALKAAVELEAEKDERIASAVAEVTFDQSAQSLSLDIIAETAEGPFALTLLVTGVSVALVTAERQVE